MDMEAEEAELSPDFYEESAGPYLQVATLANSKFYSRKTFEGHSATAFMLLSSSESETSTHWAALRQCETKDVVLW